MRGRRCPPAAAGRLACRTYLSELGRGVRLVQAGANADDMHAESIAVFIDDRGRGDLINLALG